MRASSSRLVISVFGLLLAVPSFAEEYKFNAQGSVKSETDQQYKFVVPANGGKKNDEYVQEAEANATNLFKVPLGYPKKEVYASVNPGFNGFKNILAGDRVFTYGGNATSGSFGARFVPSLESDFGLSADILKVDVPDFSDTAAGLVINSSSVTLYTIVFDGMFCKVRDNAFNRFCGGVRLGLDTFPTLQFPQSSNTAIELATVRDMTLGVAGRYERALGGSVNFQALLAYDMGLKQGQASDLATTSNNKVSGLMGFEWPGLKLKWNVAAGFEYRTAKLESKQDTWEIQNTSYAGKLGIIYEWGAL